MFRYVDWEELGILSSSQTLIDADRSVRKPQIAIEYAYRFQQTRPQSHVFWMYATSYATFLQACHNIARSLKLPACDEPGTDPCELVSKWLNEEDHSWLMILDNADNAELFFPSAESDLPPATITQSQRPLNDYLPSILNPQKSLHVTTRSRLVGQDLAHGEMCVEVPPLSPQEAMQLLELKAKGAVGSFDKHSTERLLDVLGYNPLAITQAAAFMNRNRMTRIVHAADRKISDCYIHSPSGVDNWNRNLHRARFQEKPDQTLHIRGRRSHRHRYEHRGIHHRSAGCYHGPRYCSRYLYNGIRSVYRNSHFGITGGVIFQNELNAGKFQLIDLLATQLASQFSGSQASANIELIGTLPENQQVVVRKAYFEALRALWIMVRGDCFSPFPCQLWDTLVSAFGGKCSVTVAELTRKASLMEHCHLLTRSVFDRTLPSRP